MNIILGGDFYIADKYKNHNLLDDSVIDLFSQADYRIVNLEAPLTPDIPKNKIQKTGPHLRSSEETMIPYLKQLNIDLVTLANNHILDYGSNGLSDTFNTLSKNNIAYVGAGNNLHEAAQSFTVEKDGVKLAILNFAEKEWSIAGQDTSGANPLDIIDNVNQIKASKKQYDKVICIIHGGHEYYTLPSPRMVKQYRFYVDNGADAIIGHHPHCMNGFEFYNRVPIFYSLGNFLFTKKSKHESWYKGLILQLTIKPESQVDFALYPVQQKRETFAANILQAEPKNSVLLELNNLNKPIANQQKLIEDWNSFVNENKSQYLSKLSPLVGLNNKYFKLLLLKFGINTLILNSKFLRFILVFLKCESHSEFLVNSIETKLNSIK